MGARLAPHHLLNLIAALLLVAWGSARVSPLLLVAGGVVGYPPVWVWLVRAGRGAQPRTGGRRLYARATVALSVLVWAGCVLATLLVGLLWFVFRPRDASVEVLADSGPAAGLGRVENHTHVQPELGDGLVRRNRYVFVLEESGDVEEIGQQTGEAGRLSVATNAALHGTGERLELVVGAFHARRSLAGVVPRWRAWEVGHAGERACASFASRRRSISSIPDRASTRRRGPSRRAARS